MTVYWYSLLIHPLSYCFVNRLFITPFPTQNLSSSVSVIPIIILHCFLLFFSRNELCQNIVSIVVLKFCLSHEFMMLKIDSYSILLWINLSLHLLSASLVVCIWFIYFIHLSASTKSFIISHFYICCLWSELWYIFIIFFILFLFKWC